MEHKTVANLPQTESEADRAKMEELYELGRKIPPVPADLPEPRFSENAWYIGKSRYAFRDEKGQPCEGPREMLWRIAYNVATAERLYDKYTPAESHIKAARAFYEIMARQEYIANTPTMLNAGKPKQQLSACFVLPVEDSLDSILQTATNMAKIHKSGGGTGFSFSRLRPKGDVIGSSGGTTTGPIAFMQTYNDITSSIRQGGVRRGANMGILHYTHPDILLFMIYKVEEFSLTNFNISVTTDEAFFEAVERDAAAMGEGYDAEFDYDALIADVRATLALRDQDLKLVELDKIVARLREWCEESNPARGYDLVNPRTGEAMGRLNAKKVFDLITRLAWQYGDPGMIMMDRINDSRANPTPQLGQIEATNPCGEQPLLPYDACTLGSLNLARFINVTRSDFDWERLRAAVHVASRFLDDVLDMNEYPIEPVRQTTRAIRRIGLGIMGFADALLALRVGYNTDEGTKMAERVMKFIQMEADRASVELARERGVFPAFEGSIYDKPGEIRPRNGARTTIAPTGTIALLADCSSGCEPLFALTYARNTIEGKRMFQTSPYLVAELEKLGLAGDEILEKIQANGGSVQGLEEIPEELQRVFVVAGDITPEWHIKMQAAFQKFVDNAISKTINFPNSATVEDVRDAYMSVYRLGCKGITIYRDGSRDKQVLEVKKEGSYYDKLKAGGAAAGGGAGVAPVADGAGVLAAAAATVFAESAARDDSAGGASAIVELKKRPTVLTGRTYKVATHMGAAYVSINEDEGGNIFEVFIHLGRAGSDTMADAEAIGRLISLAFRIPSDYSSDRIAQNVIDQLSGIGGSSAAGFGANRIRSLADAVAKAIADHETFKTQMREAEARAAAPGQLPLIAAEADGVAVVADDRSADGVSVGAAVVASVAPARVSRKSTVDLCPDCGNASLRRIEGCQKCEICGFSKC